MASADTGDYLDSTLQEDKPTACRGAIESTSSPRSVRSVRLIGSIDWLSLAARAGSYR